MPRLNLIACAAAAALLAGCSGGPHAGDGPVGLAYQCGGEPAMIAYNGQGYLPGSSVREADGKGDFRQNPRATASLWFRNQRHELIADDTLEDLRYIGTGLVWVARAETANLSLAGENDGQPLACTRVRSPNASPPAAAGAGEHHDHGAGEESPHGH